MKRCVLALSAVVALTACGGGGADTPPSPETAPAPKPTWVPDEEATPVPSVPPSEPAAAVVEIEYLHRLPDHPGMQLVADVAARWNATHLDIQVSATKFDGERGEMLSSLEEAVKAGTAPCLAQLAYGEVPEMFVKGLVADVSLEAAEYRENFGGAFGLMSLGGITVGLPQDSGPLVYYYNAAQFEELGLEVPTSLDGFVAAAKAAAAEGKYIVNFTADDSRDWLSAQAAAAGDAWYTAEHGRWVINTEGDGTQRIAAMWQDLLDNDAAATHDRWDVAYSAAIDDTSLIGDIGAAWEAAFILDDSPTAGDWRVALLPDFGAGQMSGAWGGSGVAVMKGCEHPAEAMEFTNWFNSQLDALASQGLVVAALGEVDTPPAIAAAFGGQDVYAVLAEANARMNAEFNYIPGWSTVAQPVEEAAAAAVEGSGSVADIFAVAGSASVQALREAGLPVKE